MNAFKLILILWQKFIDFIPEKSYQALKDLILNFRYLFFIGRNYYCPICNKYFRKLLPYGIESNPTLNTACPKCDSLSRHRLIWVYLIKHTNFLSENCNILNISPQYCFLKAFKSLSNLNYISADIDSLNVDVRMDITNINSKSNAFDLIICNHVLEHVLDDKRAMKELYRVLKPDGLAIISCPIDLKREKTFEDPSIIKPEDRMRVYGQQDHLRIYGRDFKKLLENVGFIIKIDNYVNSLGNMEFNKLRIDVNEKIYFCTKKQN